MKKILWLVMMPFLMGVQSYGTDGGPTKENWPPDRVDTNLLIQDDRFVPIPWSIQKPFPWSMIEGTWLAQNGDFESYFSFKVRMTGPAARRVEVRQVDVVTCRTVAIGLGYLASFDNRTVSAYMEFLGYRQSYKVMLRSYNYGGPVKDISVSPVEGQVVLLSILPQDRANYVHMALTKVSKDPRLSVCRPKTIRR